MASILPNGPIANYIKSTEMSEEQFFEDLKNRDPGVTSIFAAEEIAYSLQELVAALQQAEGGFEEEGYGGGRKSRGKKRRQRDWW